MKAPQILIVAILCLSAAGTSLTLAKRLAREDLLRGADAYYYALQSEYFAKTGAVKIPDSSPIHRLTGSLREMGLSSEGALRLWQTASLFLFFLGMLALARWWRRDLSLPAALLLVYLGLSPSLLFVAIEFPKFFAALLLLPFWPWPLNAERRHSGWAWAALPLACLLHRGAVPLAALFGLAALAVQTQRRLRLSRAFWLGLAALSLLGLAALFLLPDRFRLLDLERLAWEAPRAGYFSLLSRTQLPLAVKAELILIPILTLGLAWRLWKRQAGRRAVLLPFFALWLPAFFPFGGEEVFGVGERYAILLPALGLMACLVFLSTEAAPPWKKRQFAALALLAWVPGALAGPRLEAAHPKTLDPDFEAYRQVSEELAGRDIPMLIAHKGLVFYYKYRWMREAFPYEPERHWDKTRIWRLAYGITPDELHYRLSEECGWESERILRLATPSHILIREDCWQDFRKKIRREDDAALYERVWESPQNPSQHRPAFLYPKHAEDQDDAFPALPKK